MNFNTEWKKWAVEFISAKTEPMSKELSNVFMMCCMAELQNKDLGNNFKMEFMYKIIDKRAQFVGLNMTEAVKVILCMLCDSPGTAVMYIYALRYSQVNAQLTSIDTLQLAQVFKLGFPTEAELSRLWDLQKVKGVNLLDQITKEITNEELPTDC